MPSQYDFQSLDRQLTNLEKELAKFDASFDDITTTISKAKFNDREYGSQAISKKINNLVDSAKNRISSAYNKYINGMRRASHDSLETIKKAANAASQYCDDLNELLEDLNSFNSDFANGEYEKVIATSIRSDYYPSEIKNYVLLLKMESYDSICKEESKDVSIKDFQHFKSYYSLCKEHHAVKHLPRSASFLFLFAAVVSSDASNSSYQVYIDGLKAYQDIPEEKKGTLKQQYQSLYSKAVSMFNNMCEEAYAKFDYIKVKSLLNDSLLFSKQDISNDFFKDGDATPQKLFDYASSYSNNAAIDVMRIVFDDTKALSQGDNSENYLMFWLGRYDDYGFIFIKQIIDCQGDRFKSTGDISDWLPAEFSRISKKGSLLFDLASDYQVYLEQISDRVPLMKFSQTAVKWAKLIKKIDRPSNQNEQLQLNNAIELLDGLAYSMIVKYQKYCNCFDDQLIDDLNVVLDESSNRLYGKPYKKDLKKAVNNKEPVNSLTVKLVSVQIKKRRRKKALLVISIITALLVIAAIIVYFIFFRTAGG